MQKQQDAYEQGKLHYVAKGGTRFDATTLVALYQRFQPLVSSATTLVDPPRERDVTYLLPDLIGAIPAWAAGATMRPGWRPPSAIAG